MTTPSLGLLACSRYTHLSLLSVFYPGQGHLKLLYLYKSEMGMLYYLWPALIVINMHIWVWFIFTLMSIG